MPIYTPVNAGFRAETYESELLAFRLNGPGILGPGFTADFLLSKSLSQMLSVTFSADSIVRILDEFPLSSEGNDGENIGLIPNVFVYTVSGTTFESSQSEAWRDGRRPIHYRFPTNNMCLDVLTPRPADFRIVPIPEDLLAHLT